MIDNTDDPIVHDLIVIGTGTAANVVAGGCRKAGWSVAVIDHRPFGGTCALRGDGFEVEAHGPGGRVVIAADLAIHSGGRAPALEALDLDAAGIAHDRGRLTLDETFRSASNPAVYAAGGPLRLTPVAALEAHVVVDNLLGKQGATLDYTGIPSAVFTLPALARVGLLEAEARTQGLRFMVKHESVPGWYTARRVNQPCYGYKVLVEDGSGRILGAHLIGPDAAEVINLFAFAMRSGLTAAAIRHATFTYPTAASDIQSMLP